MITFVRRRGLGFGSVKSICQVLREEGYQTNIWRSWRDSIDIQENAVLFRWGCTTTIPTYNGQKVLNQASQIHRVNDKATFASTLGEVGLGPDTLVVRRDAYRKISALEGTYVMRPDKHSRGRNLVCGDKDTLTAALNANPSKWLGGYVRPLIQKKDEYRVYVVQGRVASVAKKIPEDRSAVAWNHALGATFENVRWDDWNSHMLDVAIKGAALSGLYYAAVDVMVEEDTLRPWIIEINSAGSLPRNEDGSPSYRARCVAKSLAWSLKNSSFDPLGLDEYSGWRHYIHPGVWRRG